MNDVDIEINSRMMKEFDFEQGNRKRVYSHETGELITIKGKEMVVPGAIPGKDSVEFDPMNNVRMMNALFGAHLGMLQQIGEIDGDVLSYNTIRTDNNKVKTVVKIVPYDGGPIQEIESKPYRNETSCIAQLVCAMNGDDNADMSHYDYDRQQVKLGKIKPPKPLEKKKVIRKPKESVTK